MANKVDSNLSFSEFCKLVPTETVDFVKDVLNADEYYGEDSLSVGSSSYSKALNKQIVYMLSFLAESKTYRNLLSKNGFAFDRAHTNKSYSKRLNYEDLFSRNYKLFGFYSDVTLYKTMTPMDIFLHTKKIGDGYSNVVESMFPSEYASTVTSNFEEFEQKIKAEQRYHEEQVAYGELSIEVIHYLEAATRIRQILLSNAIIADKDVTPLSLLLALGYETKDDSKEAKTIRNYLIKNGMNFNKTYQIKNVDLYAEAKKKDPNVFAILPYYKRYFTTGRNSNIQESDVKISDIVANLIDRDFTDSLIVEDILHENGIKIETLENIEKKLSEQEEYDRKIAHQAEVNKFYELLGKDEREFVQFVTKTYMLILKKMKEGKHNQNMLLSEDDADTLALLIAAYYYQLDISVFFKDNGINLEGILKLLKLDISEKEILAMELDVELMINKFGRFVTNGVNSNSKEITVNSISYNLCNREFNRSMIIENIYGSLSNGETLSSDFLGKMKSYIEDKKKKSKTERENSFLVQFSPDMREFLKNLNHWSEERFDGISDDVARVYSILLSLLDNGKDVAPLKELGFERSRIEKLFNWSSPYPPSGLNFEFLNACLNQVRTQKENYELTEQDIIIGLFSHLNKEQMESIKQYVQSFPDLPKILKDLAANSFANFAKVYEQQVYRSKLTKDLNDNCGGNYAYGLFAIHKELMSLGAKEDDDLREKSILLLLFRGDNSFKTICEKRGLTVEKVLTYMGLDPDFLEQVNYQNYDIETYEQYREMLKGKYYYSSVAKILFDKKTGSKSNFVEKMCQDLNVSYTVLEVETLTGEDYEKTLTIPDRIVLLRESPVETIDFDDASSLLTFGEALAAHSKYIYDEVPALTAIDSGKKSIDTINGIINRARGGKTKAKGILAKIFRRDTSTPSLSRETVSELRGVIEENLVTLRNETIGFDGIRQYMEEYMAKNDEFLKKAEEAREEILSHLQQLDENKESDYSKIVALKSRLKIVEAKIGRFKTTNLLMKQEIIKINQAIVNHFITINALEMARDDLFPLIGSELALLGGRSTEASSMMLTKGVISLFQSLLERNIAGVNSNMNAISQLDVPEELMQALTKDVQSFVSNLEEPQEQKRIGLTLPNISE